MARLIALDMPASQTFVENVQRIWENGDAVLPLDQRLPHKAKQDLIRSMAPAEVVDAHSTITKMSDSREVDPGDALVIATSGSTGTPKGVIHTHRSLAAAAKASRDRLSLTSADHWLVCIPVSHIGGFSVINRALYSGARITLHPSFEPQALMQSVRSGVTHTSLVATALSRIDGSGFKTILLGGGPAPADLPTNVVTTYGMTETGGGIVYDDRPLDCVEIKIVGGEISVRCEMLMRGYRGDQGVATHDGWFATGDMGHVDESGTVRVFGRRTEMIITGGENVWPAVVELALLSHPLVDQVVVRGVPDPHWGQRVVAFVVLSDSTSSPGADELRTQLREHVKQTLPTFCAPHQIVTLNTIPLTSLGKTDFQALPST